MKKTTALALILCVAASAAAAEEDAFEFYKEEAQVVIASRRPEPAWRAPVAVDVVTADEIRAYGYREVWDALRYRVGMDVISGRSLDGNRALVSARGFDSEFVTQMQVLVDGRSVYSPLLGGVYWQSLPVQIQDIERIEIVRGPNAVLYGSNAGLGVVNIITKRPAAGRSVSAGAWGGNREAYDARASANAGDAAKGLSLSYDARAEEGHPAPNGGAADDFLHLNKLNARGRWTPLPETEVEFLGGGSWMSAGVPGLTSDAESRHVQNFEALKGSRALGDEAAVEASLSRAEMTIDDRPLAAGAVAIRTYQYDAEALHRFVWLDGRVKSNWGGGWRLAGADSDQAFASPRQSNRLVRGFTHHSVFLSDAFTVVGGASLEHSDTGGTQPAWQAAVLATPSDSQALRASYSFAPTSPPLMERAAHYLLAPNKYYVGNPAYGPEKLSTWELGWNGRFLDGALKPAVSLYYMEIGEFSGLAATASGPDTLLSTVNNDRAFARGAELSADYSLSRSVSAFANYAYERITNRRGASATGEDPAQSTPRHKVNFGARAALPRGFTASALLGYKDTYAITSDSRGTTTRVGRHFRLDARLAWSPRPGWEVFVAGQELLQPRFVEFADGTASARLVRGGVEGRFDF